MRILVTGDWHLGVTSYGVLDSDGVNSRLLDVKCTTEKIAAKAHELKVDLIIHCGDVFHTNRPTTNEQLVFWRFLHMAHDVHGIDVRVIIGNHDYNSQIGKGHALKLFMQMYEGGGVKIYDKTTWEMIDDCYFCFYPYGSEKPDFGDLNHGQKRTFLVCHSHLEGALVGAEPYEIKNDKATKFKELPVDGVLAGHFHKPQILCHAPLAFYPGSIQPVDFNERMDVKGVMVLDTEELSISPCGFETRRLVQYDTDDPSFAVGDDVKDAIVKINMTLNESNAHKFDELAIRKRLSESGVHSIASINLKINREQVLRDPDIVVDANVRANFERFLKQKDYGELSDQIREAGFAVIEEASK